MTRPSGGGLRKQSRQLQMILAHAASDPHFCMFGPEMMLAQPAYAQVTSAIASW